MTPTQEVYTKVFRDQRNYNADMAAEFQARLEVENVSNQRALAALTAIATVVNTMGLTQMQLEKIAKCHPILEKLIVLDPKAGPDDPTSLELLAQALKVPSPAAQSDVGV